MPKNDGLEAPIQHPFLGYKEHQKTQKRKFWRPKDLINSLFS